LDFRRKAWSIREKAGLTIAEVATRFGVGIASVVRWLKQIEPPRTRHKPATKIDMAALAREVRDCPAAYQYEGAQRLGVSHKGIDHALRRLGLTYKKPLRHPKADEHARRICQAKIATYETAGRTIVYIDDSGFAHDMPRTHGYAPAGHRCHGRHHWHARDRTKVIGALMGCGLLTVGLFSVTVDADVVTAWVKQARLPKLTPACVLVMDNATCHKRQDPQKALASVGHRLEYLPPSHHTGYPHTKPIRDLGNCQTCLLPDRPGLTAKIL
jgi:transposase